MTSSIPSLANSAFLANTSLNFTLKLSTASSSYTVRTAAKSTGALERERTLETLFEEDAAAVSPTSASSPALVHDAQRESVRPKLPVRAHTSPGQSSSKRRTGTASASKEGVKPVLPTVIGVG